MNLPKISPDGNGGSRIEISNARPDHVKFGIGAGVIVTLALLVVNLVFSIGARSTKYDAACKQIEDHEERLRAVEKAVADLPRIMDNTDSIKEMLRQHIKDSQ